MSGSGSVFCSCPKATSCWNKAHSTSPILLLRQCPSFHGKENLGHTLKGNYSMVKGVPEADEGGSRSAGTCLAVETELASQECLILSVRTDKKIYCLVEYCLWGWNWISPQTVTSFHVPFKLLFHAKDFRRKCHWITQLLSAWAVNVPICISL